jgi:hypothetical protein
MLIRGKTYTQTLILLHLVFGSSNALFGQADSVMIIDNLTKAIDNSSELSKTTFTANEIYQQVTDNGGKIIILHDGENIHKITREIGLSYGYISTTFYFKNDVPIKIIETEKNYRWRDDESAFDYTKLDQVFYWEYYIFNYDYDQGVINRTGDPVFSEPVCGLFEYEGEIERIRSYFLKVYFE